MIAIDTNLLVYAHRSGTVQHIPVQRVFEKLAEQEISWGIPLFCISEFIAVVTRVGKINKPTSNRIARRFLEALVGDGGGEIWQPGYGFHDRLYGYAEQLGVVGPRIFDLQIAIAAADNGAIEIWSCDKGFSTIPSLDLVNPLE